jgi:hypothetical protein
VAFVANTDAAVVSTEGRGVFGVAIVSSALPAIYFEPRASAAPAGEIAVLRRDDASPMPWGRVRVTVRSDTAANSPVARQQVRTDEGGRVFLPPSVAAGGYVVDLEYAGDGSTTPTSTRYRLAVR